MTKKNITSILLKNKTLHFIILAAYMTMVFVLSLMRIETEGTPMFFDGFDKVVHFGFYVIMTFMIVSLLDKTWKIYAYSVIVSLLITATIGGFIEYIQPYFGRTCDLDDMIANTFGNITGACIYSLIRKKVKKTISESDENRVI